VKLHKMEFQGIAVGIQLEAEDDAERRLLWALRNLPARVSETYGYHRPDCLFLVPALPWLNQTSAPLTPPDASA
jgi:hypothetical protein